MINGKFYENMWMVYDFLLRENVSKKDVNTLLDTLLAKYKESLELISPQCLSAFVKCSKQFSRLITEPHQTKEWIEIFEHLYKLIWDIEVDVKNFNESLEEFLDNFLTEKLVRNDADDNLYKNTVAKVSFFFLFFIEKIFKRLENIQDIK